MPKNPPITVDEVKEEVRTRLRRAIFDMNEDMRKYGDESPECRYSNGRVQILEQLMWFLESDYDIFKDPTM